MRIALCLYGKLREHIKCRPAWESFQRAYNPDIFQHMWGDTHMQAVLNETNTKMLKIDQDIDFSHLHPGIDQYSSSAKNVLPQTYSIMQSDKLRTDYENLMGFKYDWVVRSRFDLSLHAPTSIPFHSMENINVYVCANHWPGDNGMYDDNIMIGSSFDMEMISPKLFNYAIAQIQNHKVIPSGEQLLSAYMERRHAFTKKIEELNFTLGRNL